jgi:sec-independent protein translocase protein TatA
MLENIGAGELLIIIFVILILFGSKKIPEMARNFGKGISEFKKGMKDVQDNLKITDEDFNTKEKKS